MPEPGDHNTPISRFTHRVLLSGGMDSAVALAQAVQYHGRAVDAVFFKYGQRHLEKERAAAERLALHFGVPLWQVTLQTLKGSSLTDQEGALSGSPVVVPDRNRTMLHQAAAMFPPAAVLVMGCCRDDWELFEDCRLGFFEEMSAELAPVKLFAPFVYDTKEGIIHQASRYGGTQLLGLTWSCYGGGKLSCGTCGACAPRLRAFWRRGEMDPVNYQRDSVRVPCARCLAPVGVRCHHPDYGWTSVCPIRSASLETECGDWSPSYDARQDDLSCASCGGEHLARNFIMPCGVCDECCAGIRCRELG